MKCADDMEACALSRFCNRLKLNNTFPFYLPRAKLQLSVIDAGAAIGYTVYASSKENRIHEEVFCIRCGGCGKRDHLGAQIIVR